MVPMPSTKVPLQVQDFIALPLRLPAHRAYPKESTHYLYLRPNVPRIPTDSTPQEVFAVNVPIDATIKNLRRLFAEQLGGGRIEDVDFEDAGMQTRRGIKARVVREEGKKGKKRKRGADAAAEEAEEVGQLPATEDRPVHRSGATAILRFVDATSAQLALREARKFAKAGRHVPWPTASDDTPLGLERYKTMHTLRYPSHSALQESTDAYMTAFAASEAEAVRQLARQRAEPDEDGFITVVRGGRSGGAARAPQNGGDGGEGEGEREGAGKKKKRHKGMVEEGFYRFQVRERKKREHGELARKFEEDARRVEGMRKRRGKVRPE